MKGGSRGSAPNDRRALITCAGDWNLFCTLEAALVAAIPQDGCEWRRSYGRVFKKAFVEATFERFCKDALPGAAEEGEEERGRLVGRPVFHVYWTDCADVETYKTATKDDIEAWHRALADRRIADWMIVLVETYDARKTNKLLPRTTVLDKIRGDFASKNGDRCLSVINPVKSESRSAESWRGLVARVRHLVLAAYNKTLVRFEEHMREQRDRRNEPAWNFCEYFLLQEQLAFVLEMLGLPEEALIQYDELDALFTQFVLNSTVAEFPAWLSGFQKPVEMWRGISLSASNAASRTHEVASIKWSEATLVDFRTYLFQRQSAMLLSTSKPWEIASRCLSVVHNTSKELAILDVGVPAGGFACWALLMCLEVLQTCERLAVNAPHQVIQQCSNFQAPLWHYAKDKLWELGKLCGLLPGTPEPSSAQIHLVVTLSAGMGEVELGNATPPPTTPAPIDKLKEALGSKQAFQMHYLELAELAMGTYKHIGRLRCARFIGRDLASFYSELGETSKACVFLLDALRSYEEQGWKDLAAQTRMELVACYLKMSDFEKYTKLSATISCTPELEILVRNFYFDEMVKTIKNKLAETETTVLCELNDCFKLVFIEILPSDRGNYIKDSSVRVNVILESHFPREVLCRRIAICLEEYKNGCDKNLPDKTNKTEIVSLSSNLNNAQPSPAKKGAINKNCPDPSNNEECITSCKLDDLKAPNPIMSPLNMTLRLDWKEDKTLDTASVQCNNPKPKLRRTDSAKYRKPSATQRADYTRCLNLDNFLIKPGVNVFVLETMASQSGAFRLGQISLVIENTLEYLSDVLRGCKLCYEVITQGISVALNKVDPKRELLAGVEHNMELIVKSGSMSIDENCSVNLKASNGLTMLISNAKYQTLVRELEIPIQSCKPFSTITVPLTVFASLPPKKDDKPMEHKVWIHCPWLENPVVVTLHFSPPFSSTWKLLTSNTRKFIHVTVTSSASDQMSMVIVNPKLQTECPVTLVNLNPKNEQTYLLDSNGTSASFMWELQMNPLDKAIPIKVMFSIMYKVVDEVSLSEDLKEYKCPFEMQEYQTLFLVKSKVEPTKGSEFCRASQMCYLQLSVQKVNETDFNSLMYEVLADQTMWAVCGRTAGVITMDNTEPQTVTLEVMPLIAGHLPLPTVRLSKYIAAIPQNPSKDGRKPETMSSSSHPRLEPFQSGQVYHSGKAQQVHVLASISNNDPH